MAIVESLIKKEPVIVPNSFLVKLEKVSKMLPRRMGMRLVLFSNYIFLENNDIISLSYV